MGFWQAVSLRLLTLFCYTSALVQTMPTVNKTKTKKNKILNTMSFACTVSSQGCTKMFFLMQEQKIVLRPTMWRKSKC